MTTITKEQLLNKLHLVRTSQSILTKLYEHSEEPLGEMLECERIELTTMFFELLTPEEIGELISLVMAK